jgi:DNA-nicking Smr family endonuclease
MGKRGHPDDDELWDRVAATATPLRKRKASKPTRTSAAERTETPAPKPRTKSASAVPKKPTHAAGAPLDRQTSRHLEKGRIAVEARLDLHGMRQADAHAQLKRFLKSAQARGLKHVLVITGKGAEGDAKSFYEEDERGVLRKVVPHWLADKDLSPLVVSFSPAPRRLGGEGALYVRLRRPR